MTSEDNKDQTEPEAESEDKAEAAPEGEHEPPTEEADGEEASDEGPSDEGSSEEGGEDASGEEGDEASSEEGGEEEGEDLEAQVADLNDKLLRALAETENIRRRAQRDTADASKYAVSNFAREMLTVSDNLQRAMDSVDPETRANDAAVEQIMAGLEMTAREVLNTFERFGIKTIEAMGEKFDHNLHEAMFEMEDTSKPAGTVVQVVETGYVLNDRLLRPAKVGVSKGGPKENGKANANDEAPPVTEEASKEGQAAYEDKGEEPGAQLDEEL